MKVTYQSTISGLTFMPAPRHRPFAERVAALTKTELFNGLTDELLNEIAGLAVVRSLSRGQVLFSEGEDAAGLYVVVAGELRSIRQSAVGREQVLSAEGPGAVLALAPLFDGGKFYSTVIADRNSSVLVIEKHTINALCREHPELLWNVARVFAHKLRHLAGIAATLALRNVEQRVAEYLLTLAREKGARSGKEGVVFELTLTKAELATRIGSVREVVSRALTQLHQSRIIRMEGRRLIAVPNIGKLEEFAGAEHDREIL